MFHTYLSDISNFIFFVIISLFPHLIILQVSDGVLLSASGCMSDFLELKQILIKNTKSYEWENREIISVNALSSLLAFILYSRRTFPCKYSHKISAAIENFRFTFIIVFS